MGTRNSKQKHSEVQGIVPLPPFPSVFIYSSFHSMFIHKDIHQLLYYIVIINISIDVEVFVRTVHEPPDARLQAIAASREERERWRTLECDVELFNVCAPPSPLLFPHHHYLLPLLSSRHLTQTTLVNSSSTKRGASIYTPSSCPSCTSCTSCTSCSSCLSCSSSPSPLPLSLISSCLLSIAHITLIEDARV